MIGQIRVAVIGGLALGGYLASRAFARHTPESVTRNGENAAAKAGKSNQTDYTPTILELARAVEASETTTPPAVPSEPGIAADSPPQAAETVQTGPIHYEAAAKPHVGGEPAETYTAQAGDLPGKIAARFGVTVGELIDANPEHAPKLSRGRVKTGSVLRIPSRA